MATSIKELQYALAVKPSHEDLNPEEDLLQQSIVDSMAGLIITHTSWEGQTVHFVHFTFKGALACKLYYPFSNWPLPACRGHFSLPEL